MSNYVVFSATTLTFVAQVFIGLQQRRIRNVVRALMHERELMNQQLELLHDLLTSAPTEERK